MRSINARLVGLVALLLTGAAQAGQPTAQVNLGALAQLKASTRPIHAPKKAAMPALQRRVVIPLRRPPPPPLPLPPPRAPSLTPTVISHPPSPTATATVAPTVAIRPIPPLAVGFASDSARLSTDAIIQIEQFAAHPIAPSARIMIAANAAGTAQNPARAYRLAFARGRAVRDRLIHDGIPLTHIIVQSQILPKASLPTDQRAILTLIP